MSKDKNKKHPGGRPTKLDEIDYDMLYKLLLLGLNDEKLAKVYGVTLTTLQNWKDDPKFFKTYQEGKVLSDTELISALRKKALGYNYKEVTEYEDKEGNITNKEIKHKVKHPETGAIKHLLANRHPDIWREKSNIEITGKDGQPLQLQTDQIDFNKIDKKHLEALQELVKLTAPDSLNDLEDAETIDTQEDSTEQLEE
jgi:hypothetical protein